MEIITLLAKKYCNFYEGHGSLSLSVTHVHNLTVYFSKYQLKYYLPSNVKMFKVIC